MGNCFACCNSAGDERTYESYRICSNNYHLIRRDLYFTDVDVEYIDALCYIPYEYSNVALIDDRILITTLEYPTDIDILWGLDGNRLQLLSLSNDGCHSMTYKKDTPINLRKILSDYVNYLQAKNVTMRQKAPPMTDEAYKMSINPD